MRWGWGREPRWGTGVWLLLVGRMWVGTDPGRGSCVDCLHSSILWVPASTAVNAHIFFFYKIYRKGRSEHSSVFSCLNFVLPVYLISSCSCGWDHINQMLQSLIPFLPVPVNSFWLKICALCLAMYVNTLLLWKGRFGPAPLLITQVQLQVKEENF